MKKQTIWVVVEVKSGIPVSTKAFASEQLAINEENLLRTKINLENDETSIFQIDIPENIHQ